MITENGRILDVNDRVLALSGYSREELIGRSALDLISPEARKTVADNMRNHSEVLFEHDMIRKNGTRYRVEARASVM